MIDRLEPVHDRDLTPEQLAEREVWRRKHQIDAQIVIAIEKGNPVELLLTHPAGLIKNPGGCRHLNSDVNLEIAYIRQRYADLKGRFDVGGEFIELDAEITERIQAGKRKGDREVDELSAIKVRGVKEKRGERGAEAQKFARARAHKDLSEFRFRAFGKTAGWLRELTDADLVERLGRDEAAALAGFNAARSELGLPSVALQETG